MSAAMDWIGWDNEHQRLMRLAEVQRYFLKRYAPMIEDLRCREYFERDFLYAVSLAYREAQEPLVKQMTDFVLTNSRPIIFDAKEEKRVEGRLGKK